MSKRDWIRHSVAVPSVTRVIDSWLFDKRTMDMPKRIERTEMVHQNDIYRRKTKRPEGKVLWHRGAKVGVV